MDEDLEVIGEELTDRQKAFCIEYLWDFNASKAYVRAGYKTKDEQQICQNASALKRNPKIKAYIDLQRRKHELELVVDKAKILAIVEREATGTHGLDTNASARAMAAKLLAEITETMPKATSGALTIDTSGPVSIKMVPATKATE